MQFTITILRGGEAIAESTANEKAVLVFEQAYQEGDVICLKADEAGYAVVQLEDSLAPVTAYLNGTYTLTIPFGEKKVAYSDKNFAGEKHLLTARTAQPWETVQYRNLAFNTLDSHENNGLYPHASANVETRGESVFAARNAVNGNTANASHGSYPYESWGVNRQDDAEIVIDFGHTVMIDRAVITLRADFPHDNWWQSALLTFSDGSTQALSFEKTDLPQSVSFAPRAVTSAKLHSMKKDLSDPSPFPALTQIELWGAPCMPQ